jgi:hypothetical protein
VVSDNGASAEGGAAGTTNELQFFNNVPESREESLARIDEFGGFSSGTAARVRTAAQRWLSGPRFLQRGASSCASAFSRRFGSTRRVLVNHSP